MATKKDLDPDFLLKIVLMQLFFSPDVTFFEGLTFFNASSFSVIKKRFEGNSKDEEV